MRGVEATGKVVCGCELGLDAAVQLDESGHVPISDNRWNAYDAFGFITSLLRIN